MTGSAFRAVAPVSAVYAAFRVQPSSVPAKHQKTGRCAGVRELYGNGRHRRKSPAGGLRRREKPQSARRGRRKGLALFCASLSTSARSAGSFGR